MLGVNDRLKAKAKRKIVDRVVSVTLHDEVVELTITLPQAETLLQLLRNVGGSGRGVSDACEVMRALYAANVAAAQHPLERGFNNSIYFAEGSS